MKRRYRQILKTLKWLRKAGMLVLIATPSDPISRKLGGLREVYVDDLPIYRLIYGDKLEVFV